METTTNTPAPSSVKDLAEELAKIYTNHISSVDNFKRVVEEKVNAVVEAEVEKQVRLYL